MRSFGLCYSMMWLFHLHSTVKIQPFSGFPLAGLTAKAFCRLSLWSFKEKSINHFLWHRLLKFQRIAIYFSLGVLQRKNWGKKPYFHHAVEMG